MIALSLTRRHAWLFAMSAFAVSSTTLPLRTLAAQRMRVAPGAWALTRRLSRGLADGNSIVVTRSWRVSFAEQSRGFAVAGEQMAVSVEAPPNLAPLTKIERERSTAGMFPILLAPDGRIIAAGQNTSRASFDASVETAKVLLGQSGFAEGDADQLADYMIKLQKAGSSLLDELPGDLFYPSTQPFQNVREVVLPNGSSGQFELIWEASAAKDTGLLETARREVITRIAENERRSSEDWSLTAL